MSTWVEVTMSGDPVSLARHRCVRVAKNGGRGAIRMYNPSAPAQRIFREEFLLKVASIIKGTLDGSSQDAGPTGPSQILPIEGPLEVEIHFGFQRPKSHFATAPGMLRPSAPKEKTSKPDVDNLAKFVLDALNGHAFHDDAQIVSLLVTKQFCTETRIRMRQKA